MNYRKTGWKCAVGLVGLALTAGSADAAQMTLRAVRKNGVPITPTNVVSAVPGDVIAADILYCGWNVDEAGSRARTFQARLANAAAAVSGQTGRVLPNGWDAPINNIPCVTNANCTDPTYPICGPIFYCVGPAYDPSNPAPNPPDNDGAFIDTTRPDFILAGMTPLVAVSFEKIDIALGGTDLGAQGPTDPGCASPKYGGTVNYKVGPDACGSFSIGFIPNVDDTFLELWQGPSDQVPLIVAPQKTGLTINVPNANPVCQCPELLSSVPANCSVDARFPHTPESQLEKYDSRVVRLTFAANPPPNTNTMTASDFTITTAPAGPGAPVIESVTAINATTVEITFTTNMPQRRWTCISYNVCEASANTVCTAILPGDVNSSGRTDAADLTDLIADLNRTVRLLTPFSTDMNRTNSLTPHDLVGWIDVANGGGAFNSWLNQNITSNTACPTAP